MFMRLDVADLAMLLLMKILKDQVTTMWEEGTLEFQVDHDDLLGQRTHHPAYYYHARHKPFKPHERCP